MTIEFDIGPLTWVKGEIDQALMQALENVKEFAGSPADLTPLRFCQTHVHQVAGALAMVGLDGAQRFSTEIEQYVTALEKQQLDPSSQNLDALADALNALVRYVNALVEGAPDIPLKLFPEFKALLNARGVMQVMESELFFPDLNHIPPTGPASDVPQNLPAYLDEQCQQYRQGLVQWLRDAGDQAALQNMLEALLAVERVQILAAQKALWWASAGLLEAVAAGDVAVTQNLRHLCTKLERQLHYLSRGDVRPGSRLLRDVLYFVAVSQPVSARAREIKRVFDLDDYHAALAITGGGASGQAVSAGDADLFATLRSSLDELKASWNKVSAGDTTQLEDFRQKSANLSTLAADIHWPELQQSLTDIQDCAAELTSRGKIPEPLFSIEVATSLLMLESVLKLTGKFREDELQALLSQTAAMRGVLLGETREVAVKESGHAETLAVLSQVADEIRANLQHIEQLLDVFFRNAETRGELQGASSLFKQVAGAFEMLDQHTAATVVRDCWSLAERFSQPSYLAENSEYELVAESISALEFYLAQLLEGSGDAVRAIEALPARLQVCLKAAPAYATEHVAIEAARDAAGVEPEKLVDSALDAELLDVYLTEAGEVLETIAENLQSLRSKRDDHEALVTVRRAFHTLKGSGRTVGLVAMGDVAWAVEQLLNQMLEMRAAADDLVLDFVDEVAREFHEWVQQLTTSGMAALSPSPWQARAEALRHHLTTIEAVSEAIVEAAAKPEIQAPDGEDIVIGDTFRVGRKLFALFLEEAYANLGVLFTAYAAARKHSEPLAAETTRAAHTLAGVSRTIGITALADASAALESWLEKIAPRLQQLADEELRLFDQSLAALQEILLQTANRTLPKPATRVVSELKSATGEPLAAEQLESQLSGEPSPVMEADIEVAEAGIITAATQNAQENTGVDRQLLDVFIEESNELMPMIGKQLREWQESPEAGASQQALQRALHTLKGSARMAGATELGDALHDLETQVVKAAEKGVPTARNFTDFFRRYDAANDHLSALHQQVETPVAGGRTEGLPQQDEQIEPIAVTPMMRVRSEVIDQLVNEAGEVSIARSRIERQMETFKQALLELTDSVIRVRGQLREVEIEAETQMQSRLLQIEETHETFDPLEFDRYTRFQELTRMMAESVHDVSTIQQGLLYNLSETEAALIEQSRMTKELQQGLMRTRMVRFDNVTERLHRIVRQTGGELGKPATLHLRGGEVEIDRSVLEKMVGPLEHLLRNAVAHGLEDAKQRASLRKPKVGKIELHVRQEGNEIVLSLSDDGRGLDFDKIKAKAARLGMFDAAMESDPSSLLTLIFESGFSTSEEVTQVSGRGVGLDVVRNDITSLGGRIEVVSESGKGCTFTVYLPLTLAVNQTVLVRTGEDEYLLPATVVEQVQKLKPDALAAAEQRGAVVWAGNDYPLHHLSRLLGRPVQPEPQAYMPVMLLRSGARRIAMVVDEVLGNREIVVKNVGPQLAGMSSIAGATVMGDGKVMLILNPIQMAFRESLVSETVYRAQAEDQAEHKHVPTVMVVDDSLTMRKVITRLLTREGYHALTAKDGVDALQQLQSVLPDVVLLDIEMPRMNGFELARAIRGDARTAHLPLIVISSRTADKHRNYAEELGVNVYLGKPYQEEELLSHIAEFMQASAVQAKAESTAD
ncbi:MAG TPA: Hpt domain-containing protein [Methylophilaceae bacterium]|nr:Hpt domain-containing protein [Methylophilaceae bacterium]HQR60404.1 Hpt domain-containing protein [Methylophilaceae bacterium]